MGDLLRQALINFQEYRRRSGIPFKVVLTVYDSIMIECPIQYAEQMAEIVVPECMTKQARAPRLGFTIAVDTEVSRRWDEPDLMSELLEMGFSEKFAKKHCLKDKDKKPVEKKEVLEWF